MKKLAAFLMILSVSVFTVGCGGKTDTKTDAKTDAKTDVKTDAHMEGDKTTPPVKTTEEMP
jgi:uncharacterized lipoprotein YehR (DUF1307 family)